MMDIMWPASQSHFHLLLIFIQMKFYSFSFLCDVCNEVGGVRPPSPPRHDTTAPEEPTPAHVQPP